MSDLGDYRLDDFDEEDDDEVLRQFILSQPAEHRQHHYVATACYHGLHKRCRLTCKYCDTSCQCACHRQPAT